MSAPPPKDNGSINLFKLAIPEARILREVLRSDADIDLVIPKEATPKQLYDQLEVCCRSYSLLSNAKARLRPVIGKLLALCQENPEIYTEQGIKDFQSFLSYINKNFGFSRTEAYEELRTVKQWPLLTLNEYERIGASKFAILNQFAKQSDSGSAKLLKMVQKMSTPQLRQYAAEVAHIEKGDTTGAVISFGTTLTVKKAWERLIRDPKTIEQVGSESPGRILEALIQEFSGTYGI